MLVGSASSGDITDQNFLHVGNNWYINLTTRVFLDMGFAQWIRKQLGFSIKRVYSKNH